MWRPTLVAACAERSGLTVLHYDADFERTAGLTGQPTRWIVPRGSVGWGELTVLQLT